jgi:hypothetical protein
MKILYMVRKNIPYRFQTEGSVLDTNGFPKIAPYIEMTNQKTLKNLCFHLKI